MPIPNIMNTGHTGLIAAKVGIATTGHNITNANTEGYSRQRVITETTEPRGGQYGHNTIGTGTRVARIDRINDAYLEKQIRNAQRQLSNCEEKSMGLKQIEDVFNEMNGDGINRIISRFFNEFRKLSDEPENPAIRESVREASEAVVNDFHRIRNEVGEIRHHLDSRIEGYLGEVNSLSSELAELNFKIATQELINGPPNDLKDRRDTVLKSLASYFDCGMYQDDKGCFTVDIRSSGPLVTGGSSEKLTAQRSPSDQEGKPEGAMDIRSTGSAHGIITHQLKGGKLGALLHVRDQTISTILKRLDDMAFELTKSVNEIHEKGVSPRGVSKIQFFKPLTEKDRASEWIGLSKDILENTANIATALVPDAPGDNRIAIAISQLQHRKLMDDGYATFDEWYNSIVSDVGVASARNDSALNQQKDIMTQMDRMREQISGVSIDEETTNLLQYQHAFDASAKVIQVADEMLKTVLAIKRD